MTDQVEYYNQNEELFFEDELRAFEYFSLSASDYEDKVVIPDDYASNYYEDYLLKAKSNIQKKFSHIMIDKNNYDKSEDAISKIELVKSLLESGESFEELVATYSEDIVTKDLNGNLDFFEEDVFPEEFGLAINKMMVNDTSPIIEIDNSYHILKVTEVFEEKIKSFDEVSNEIINELIESEALALLYDDYNEIDQLVLDGSSINDLASFTSKSLSTSSPQSLKNFDDEFNDIIRDAVFEDSFEIGIPKIIDLDGTVYVLSLSELIEPQLKPFSAVQADVNSSLQEINGSIKKTELKQLYLNLSSIDEINDFINKNTSVSSETFKDIKRYSSLLPQDVLKSIFESKIGSELSMTSLSGDHYFISVNAFTDPSEEERLEAFGQYSQFDTQILEDKMNDIMNEDLFKNAKIDLNEQVFNQE